MLSHHVFQSPWSGLISPRSSCASRTRVLFAVVAMDAARVCPRLHRSKWCARFGRIAGSNLTLVARVPAGRFPSCWRSASSSCRIYAIAASRKGGRRVACSASFRASAILALRGAGSLRNCPAGQGAQARTAEVSAEDRVRRLKQELPGEPVPASGDPSVPAIACASGSSVEAFNQRSCLRLGRSHASVGAAFAGRFCPQ